MTAELCDCYPTKAVGVGKVLDADHGRSRQGVQSAYGAMTDVFIGVSEVRDEPRLAAASNWLALATVAARLAPRGPGC